MNKQGFDFWFILSAKHGLLPPDKIIEPYNLTLKNMSSEEKKLWADKVYESLKPYIDVNTSITFLAGKEYQQHLLERIKQIGCEIQTPLEGLILGKRMQWLDKHT